MESVRHVFREAERKKKSKAKSTYSSTHVGRNILSCYATGGKNHVRDSKALIAVVWELISVLREAPVQQQQTVSSLSSSQRSTHTKSKFLSSQISSDTWNPTEHKSAHTSVFHSHRPVSTHCQGYNKQNTHDSFSQSSLLQHNHPEANVLE